MTDIVIPLVFYSLAIGNTINIRDYESFIAEGNASIFSKDVSIEETEVSDFHSRYYVYPDEKTPYSQCSLPIDLKLDLFLDRLKFPFLKVTTSFDAATVLLVSEYKKLDRSLEKYAELKRGWNKREEINNHTHYFDKLHYGGRCISTIEIYSNVSGDVQIFRRILRDVMGESGRLDEEAINLWRAAYEAMKNSEEVRGQMHVLMDFILSGVDITYTAFSIERYLDILAEFPKYVFTPDPLHDDPIYVTLKPLEEFDQRFKSVQKNELTECYLKKAGSMYEDLKYVYKERKDLFHNVSRKALEKVTAFMEKVLDLLLQVTSLIDGQSIYDAVNVTKFQGVFEMYYEGLDKSTESYFASYKRLYETLAGWCEDAFHKPVKGSLLVEEDEVMRKQSFSIEECQKQCLRNKKCRSVGYSYLKNRCLIYKRSTYSARILFPENNLNDMKVYDRICQMKMRTIPQFPFQFSTMPKDKSWIFN